MANEISTAGITLNYCVETTSGTRPTTGYTAIVGCKSIPDFNAEPSQLDVTSLEDQYFKRSIPGLKDVGGAKAFSFNNTSAMRTAWASLVSAAQTGKASGKSTWFEVKIPNEDSFYFSGEPSPLGLGAISVDSVLEVDAYIVPNEIHGYASAST